MANEIAKVPGMTFIRANKSYSGSHQGMRWRVWIDEERFCAAVWPQPWNFAHTDESEKTTEQFDLTEEGLSEAESWIAAQYEQQLARWKEAKNHPTF